MEKGEKKKKEKKIIGGRERRGGESVERVYTNRLE